MSAYLIEKDRRETARRTPLGRLRAYLNDLNKRHPLAYITVLAFTLDGVVFAVLFLSGAFA